MEVPLVVGDSRRWGSCRQLSMRSHLQWRLPYLSLTTRPMDMSIETCNVFYARYSYSSAAIYCPRARTKRRDLRFCACVNFAHAPHTAIKVSPECNIVALQIQFAVSSRVSSSCLQLSAAVALLWH